MPSGGKCEDAGGRGDVASYSPVASLQRFIIVEGPPLVNIRRDLLTGRNYIYDL